MLSPHPIQTHPPRMRGYSKAKIRSFQMMDMPTCVRKKEQKKERTKEQKNKREKARQADRQQSINKSVIVRLDYITIDHSLLLHATK